MKSYRKLIAAVTGVAVIVAFHKLEITVPGLDVFVMDILIGAATSLGVYQARNDS